MKIKRKLISKSKAGKVYLDWYPEAEVRNATRTGSRLQQAWDKFLIGEFEPYVPMETGMLIRSAMLATTIGSGEIIYHTPYSKYLYYGKVMVDPVTRRAGFETADGWKSRKGITKVLLSDLGAPDRDLEYSKAANKKAGPFWDRRASYDRYGEWKKFAAGIIAREFGGK